MIERITQSFMKTMREYKAGFECGHIVRHQYIDGHLLNRKSKDMAAGSYFEFLLSGGLPKGGFVPRPVYMDSGLKKPAEKRTVKDMTVDYRRVHFNAENVRRILNLDLGLEFIKVGRTLTKGRFEGTIDLICKCTKEIIFSNGTTWKVGDIIVIDIKYSGLLYDKWEKFGWAWSDLQKEYHGTQAIQYNYVSGAPFYFLVVSNTNKEDENEAGQKEFAPTEMRLFYVPVDEHMTEAHIAEGNKFYEQLKFEKEIGLIPRPSMIRCGKCPLKEGCKDRHTFPHIEEVDLTIGV